MSDLERLLTRRREEHLADLVRWLAIPSISTLPERAADVRRAAEWVRKRLQVAGCARAELIPTARHPIVYGEWLGAPGRPTILVYGHYDVQPVDPIELWTTPPFEPTRRSGRIYARGASDDKGQVIAHVLALEALRRADGKAPVNVKFVIEGEEEIGSPNLEPFLRRQRKRLACDAVVVSDTAMFAKGLPSICYGLRGLAYLEVLVRGTSRDLHSGTFGGAVANPANVLTRMLAALKDDRGRITIPGFYTGVRPPAAAERRAFARLPHADARYARAIGAPSLTGEAGYTTLERTWVRPTLDVNGLWGGFSGAGAKTVIAAEAGAKLSMRLVPGQRSADIARKAAAHLRRLAPRSVRVDVRSLHGGEPWVTSTDDPALRAAGRALERAFGRQPVFVREGGSIPVVATFSKLLGVPIVLLGFGLNDDNLHAPNEKMELANYWGGIRASAFLMQELGRG